MEMTLKFTFSFFSNKCEIVVDKLSSLIFFEVENTFSLLEDVIKRLNKFKKCVSSHKKILFSF